MDTEAPKKEVHAATPPPEPGANLRFWVSWRRRLLEIGGAAISGLLLSAAFPPVENAGLAWFAFIPLLLLPIPRVLRRRFIIGYAFGFAHFVTSLWWLNEVGFGAGVLLAAVCALFPMLWYLLFCAFGSALPGIKLNASRTIQPPRHFFAAGALPVALGALLLAAGWCGLEWIRSWLFTGFSWNQLGISQWRHAVLLKLSAFTGVYGLSFLIVFVNFVLGWMLISWIARFRGRPHRGVPWPPALAILAFLPVLAITFTTRSLPEPDRYLRVAGIQGNLTQRREWNPELLQEAIEVYDALSVQAASSVHGSLDLIVWPETALPAPVQWNDKAAQMVKRVIRKTKTHLLIGSLDFRRPPAASNTSREEENTADYAMTNSALLINPDGEVLDYYDKIHRVPFGEYVPFGKYLPWLVEMIGMGRDLLAGAEYTILKLPRHVKAGVNICYEDAYPGISRAFVERGANLLFTLTNDAWYAKSSGARQHFTHAVFRAAENRRPLFRAGNNSDTCLIWPNGKIEGLLYDPVTGSRFIRGYRVYDVPVWDELPTSFYTEYGDWFAQSCAIILLVTAIVLVALVIRRKHAKFEAINTGPGKGTA